MTEESISNLYFSPGDRFENWIILREIESTNSRKVFLVSQDVVESRGCAILKIFPRRQISLPLFENFLKKEYEILSRLSDHINIARLLPQQSYSTCLKEKEIFYLIMEYCPGGNLEEFFRSHFQDQNGKSDIFLCFEQIVQGLEYAHERGIIHGNLMEKNILLMRPCTLKISDFGLSEIIREEKEDEIQPIPLQYKAPEFFHSHLVTPKSDVWSLGIMLYRFVFGKLPFEAQKEKDYLKECEKGTIDWPSSLSPQSLEGILVYFMKQMLCIEPKKRPTAKELSQSIKRCQYLVSPEERQAFARKAMAQIEKHDYRPQGQPLEKIVLPASGSQTNKEKHTLESTKKKKNSRLYAILSLFIAIIAFVSLSIYSPTVKEYFLSVWEKIQIKKQEEKQLSKSILNFFPEIPEIRLRFQIVLESSQSTRFSWKDWESRKGKLELYYQHDKSDPKIIEISQEKLLEGSFSWEIPLEMRNGSLSFWSKARLDHEAPVLSNKATTMLQYQEDRQSYAKALQIEELYSHDLAEYEKIIQSFALYLQNYPQGLFSKQVQETLTLYHDKASTYNYQEIMNLVRKNPENLKEIQDICLSFARKYPQFSRLSKIQAIQEYCEKMLQENSYEITLEKGYIPNKLLQADCYVKVYVNQKMLWQSSVIKNNNEPRWNEKFSIVWKAGDEIKVELWDKNIGLVKDKLYFSFIANNMLSIYFFEKKLENASHWIDFACSLPERPY